MASRSWNRVELIGNLTRDPELRYTPQGSAVCTFSIATNRTFVSEGEKREEADFHRVVSWNKLAELCSQLLKKGNRVFVSGRLQNRSWEGQDGQSRQVTEIVIEDMILLTSARSNAGEEEIAASEVPSRQAEEMPSQKPDTGAQKAEEEGPKETKVSKESNESEEPKESEVEDEEEKKPKKEEVDDLDDLPF